MLSKIEIAKLGQAYLLQNNVPIVEGTGKVSMPNEDRNPETRDFFIKNNLSVVSFQSANADDELDPGIYMVFVNIVIGEVYMPKHM